MSGEKTRFQKHLPLFKAAARLHQILREFDEHGGLALDSHLEIYGDRIRSNLDQIRERYPEFDEFIRDFEDGRRGRT